MKRLIYILFLVLALRLDAALTVTNRGLTTGASTSTTLACSPNNTMSVGNMGMLLLAFPNSGTNGSTKIFTQATFNDSVGNTWTRRMDAIYDPSTANQGVEIAIYTTPIATQITTGDNATVTVSTTTLNKLGLMLEISGANGTPTYVTSAPVSDLLTTGQTSTAVTVTSSSIANTDVIIGFNGQRDNTAPSAVDTDTTNGSWSSVMGNGTGTAIRLMSQNKVVTGAGAQTWNITLASSVAWECGWIEIAEAVSTNNATNGFLIWGN